MHDFAAREALRCADADKGSREIGCALLKEEQRAAEGQAGGAREECVKGGRAR